MATKKKTAPKKKSPTSKVKEQPPVRIIVEVVVKSENTSDVFSKIASFESTRLNLDENPNFEYTITCPGVTVSELKINGTPKSNPGESGKMYAKVLSSLIYVSVDASRYSPTGTGTLQLKYLPIDKNVFSEPQEFSFNQYGQGGLFLENVKLPL